MKELNERVVEMQDSRYLISLYFEDGVSDKLGGLSARVAKKCGNNYMLDKQVPSHMTVAMAKGEEKIIINALESVISAIDSGMVKVVALGAFKPHVLYLSVLQDAYLMNISRVVNDALDGAGVMAKDSAYVPMNWLPHITIARKLTENQMTEGFRVLMSNFEPFEARVTKISVTKCNPREDVRVWDLT